MRVCWGAAFVKGTENGEYEINKVSKMKRYKKRMISMLLVLGLSLGTVMNVQAVTIDEAQKKADELKNQKSAAEEEKKSLAKELSAIVKEMEDAREKLVKKQEEIQKAEEDLLKAKVDENTQYQSMKKRIKFMYENGNTQMIEVLLESENIGDFLNKAEYAQSLSEYDREQLTAFQEVVKQVEEEEKVLKEEYGELEVLQNELIAKQDNVEAMLSEKDLQISNLEKEMGENASVLEELIKQAEAERKKQEQQAQQQQAQANNGGGGGYAPPSSGNVVSGNGQFAHPCPGAVVSSTFGYRTFDNSFHNGLDLAAPEGTPTYAADSGTVLYARWSDSAGNWVVIDHGNGFVTKYMHHTSYTVTEGQYVEKGQQVGYVGNTGNSFGAHLHFQVELNGAPVDPQLYL